MNVDRYKIKCPYCEKEYMYDFAEGVADEEEKVVTCIGCNKSFFAEARVRVEFRNTRACECLDNKNLCDVEQEVIIGDFMGLGYLVRNRCRNCGRTINSAE